MSEALTTHWAEPEVMAHYRADIDARAESWRTQYPNAWRKTEIREPAKAAHAIYLLAESDLTQDEISQEVGLAPKELNGLIYHRPELWEKRRPKIAAKLAAVTEQLADALGDKVADLLANPEKLADESVKDLALALGIVSDKAATFNGMATMKIEHVSVGKMEEYEAMRAEALRRVAEKKAGAIEAEIIHEGAEVAEA